MPEKTAPDKSPKDELTRNLGQLTINLETESNKERGFISSMREKGSALSNLKSAVSQLGKAIELYEGARDSNDVRADLMLTSKLNDIIRATDKVQATLNDSAIKYKNPITKSETTETYKRFDSEIKTTTAKLGEYLKSEGEKFNKSNDSVQQKNGEAFVRAGDKFSGTTPDNKNKPGAP